MSAETKEKISVSLKGRLHSEERKRKLSESLKEFHQTRILTDETRKRMSDAQMGKIRSEETRRRISESSKGRKHSEVSKRKMSEKRKGKKCSEERKKKLSATLQGIPFEEWTGYISFESYCPKFNEELREKIRNRDNRSCMSCGKSEILNGQRLTVHHIDGNKMQGCNGEKWGLVSLCCSCHSKITVDDIVSEFLIVSKKRGRLKSQ